MINFIGTCCYVDKQTRFFWHWDNFLLLKISLMIFRLFEWKSYFEWSRFIWTKWLPICCTWVEIVLKLRGKTHNRIEKKVPRYEVHENKLVRNNFKHKTIAKNVIKFFCYFCLWYCFVWVFFQILNFAMLFFIYSFLL